MSLTSKEYLELAIIEFEKEQCDDPNNEWLKRVIKGMKDCKQQLDQYDEWMLKCKHLEKENQELKKENQELAKTLELYNEKFAGHERVKADLIKENQELKHKYESHDFLYQNEVSKNGNLAGKIFEKDLKIQKLNKALEIIKEKNVDIALVTTVSSVEQYNQIYVYDYMLDVKWCLTQEEYELLKEVLNNE